MWILITPPSDCIPRLSEWRGEMTHEHISISPIISSLDREEVFIHCYVLFSLSTFSWTHRANIHEVCWSPHGPTVANTEWPSSETYLVELWPEMAASKSHSHHAVWCISKWVIWFWKSGRAWGMIPLDTPTDWSKKKGPQYGSGLLVESLAFL